MGRTGAKWVGALLASQLVATLLAIRPANAACCICARSQDNPPTILCSSQPTIADECFSFCINNLPGVDNRTFEEGPCGEGCFPPEATAAPALRWPALLMSGILLAAVGVWRSRAAWGVRR